MKSLLDEGYKEITLLGQNVNSYGKDLPNNVTFATLLNEIAKLPRKFRLRFMTSHPKDLTEDIIDAIAACPNICDNVHLPVQSGSTEILRKMNRHYTREDYLALVEKIRSKIPDVGITTDIMVGFPGETEEDFATPWIWFAGQSSVQLSALSTHAEKAHQPIPWNRCPTTSNRTG